MDSARLISAAMRPWSAPICWLAKIGK